MLIPQLKVSIIILALFLAGSIAAKAIGSFQSPNPALRGFIEGCEDKPQPCWYGIVPGETAGKNATVTLNGAHSTFCSTNLVFDTDGQSIEAIELKQCEGIPLGDLLVQFDMRIPNGIYSVLDMNQSSDSTSSSTWPYWKIYEFRLSNND